MIVFVTTARHAYTLRDLLEHEPTALDGRLILMGYGELLSWPRLPDADYVLADLDRLDAATRTAVAGRVDALREALPGRRVLNDPGRSLGRRELLAALAEAGVNDFRIWPLEADAAALRYPVFIRPAVGHEGPASALLADAEALRAARAALPAAPPGGWLIVEYVDVRNAFGYHEKYSAYRVGEQIIAADRSAHSGWVCKGEAHEQTPPGWAEADARFQRDNPHAAQLLPIFERAGIDYGRIDYAFARGRLQVFEINQNPMIARPALADPEWRPAMQRKTQQFLAALQALETAPATRRSMAVPGALGPPRIEGGSRLRNLLRGLLRPLGRLADEPRLIRRLRRSRAG